MTRTAAEAITEAAFSVAAGVGVVVSAEQVSFGSYFHPA